MDPFAGFVVQSRSAASGANSEGRDHARHSHHRGSAIGVTRVVPLACAALLASVLVVSLASPVNASPIGTVTNVARGMMATRAVVAGPDGNLWFTSFGNNSIGRMTPAGEVASFIDPSIVAPTGMTAGPDGNLWFTNLGTYPDYADSSIGRITTSGAVTSFPSTGFKRPESITAGPDGNLWFTNLGTYPQYADSSIERITPSGVVSNFTGIGISGPQGITTGRDGNVWFTNAFNNSIGRITMSGAVSNFTGQGISNPLGIAAGPDGNLWFTNAYNNSIGRITPAGVVSGFTDPAISYAQGIAAGPDGNVWFTIYSNSVTANAIGRITTAGIVTIFNDPGITYPWGITAGPGGNLWFANGNTIGRITTTGAVSVQRGNGIGDPDGIVQGGDGNMWFTNGFGNSIGRITPAGVVSDFTGAGISRPWGIAAGPDGNLWFTNLDNNSIGRITMSGVVSNFTGSAIDSPEFIAAGPDGAMWFTNGGNATIGRITTTGVVTNIADPAIVSPGSITAGPDGNMWWVTGNNNSIQRITPAGVVSTFTGPAVSFPDGITAGPDGNMWFANATGFSIGQITMSGVVSNFPGVGIANPGGIAAGPDGNLWFTNYYSSLNQSIGRITPTGVVSNFTGPGIDAPGMIAAGPDGAMWFTNSLSSSIGRVTAANVPDGPTAVAAAAGNGSARVSWAAPASDGGSPITGYTVTASPGGATCVWTAGPLTCTVNGLTNGVSYTFSVTATNAAGTGPLSVASQPVWPVGPGTYFHPLSPTRILDSRGFNGDWNAQLTAGSPKLLTVTGGSAAIPANADAVVMNVTVTDGTASSFLTAYPAGSGASNASNLNFAAGQTIPNLATVKVGTNGQVAFANHAGSVDVIADIAGYFDSVPADKYNALDPTRILDSRGATGSWNGQLSAGTPRTLQITSPTGVPATADAVVMNVTVTGGSANSFLKAHPAGSLSVPNASNLNFGAGQTIANLVTVKIGTNGQVAFDNAIGSVDVIADVVGYFDPSSGDVFHSLIPTRVLDSRGTTGGWNAQLATGTPKTISVASGVSAGSTAVIANTTVTEGNADSFLSVYAANESASNTSNLNFAAGQTIPNLVAVKISAEGQVAFANASGSTDVIFDLVGYFAAL